MESQQKHGGGHLKEVKAFEREVTVGKKSSCGEVRIVITNQFLNTKIGIWLIVATGQSPLLVDKNWITDFAWMTKWWA